LDSSATTTRWDDRGDLNRPVELVQLIPGRGVRQDSDGRLPRGVEDVGGREVVGPEDDPVGELPLRPAPAVVGPEFDLGVDER
jgi:hypothetical protein